MRLTARTRAGREMRLLSLSRRLRGSHRSTCCGFMAVRRWVLWLGADRACQGRRLARGLTTRRPVWMGVDAGWAVERARGECMLREAECVAVRGSLDAGGWWVRAPARPRSEGRRRLHVASPPTGRLFGQRHGWHIGRKKSYRLNSGVDAVPVNANTGTSTLDFPRRQRIVSEPASSKCTDSPGRSSAKASSRLRMSTTRSGEIVLALGGLDLPPKPQRLESRRVAQRDLDLGSRSEERQTLKLETEVHLSSDRPCRLLPCVGRRNEYSTSVTAGPRRPDARGPTSS